MKASKLFALALLFFGSAIMQGSAHPRSRCLRKADDQIIQATVQGDLKAIERALKKNANPNRGPITPLVIAASQGRKDVADLLISAGADVNAQDSTGMTALENAAHAGLTDMVSFLISKGASVDQQDNFGMTPLMVAAEAGRKDVVEKLLAAGANSRLSNYTNDRAIDLARKVGHSDIVEVLSRPFAFGREF